MAVKAGEVATDTAGGAALGTAILPGWGTAFGAAGGALYGIGKGLFGGDDAPATPNADPNNFRFGQGNGSNYTNQIAGALANRGNVGDANAQLMQQQGLGAYSVAANAQSIGAPQIQQDAADRQRQIAALGGTNASATNLSGAAHQLQQMGTNGMPMGLAAAQLRQGENANMNQALAMAHSGRSLGGGAAALQAAQFQNAQTGQVTNQQAAAANIQEQQQNQQYKLAAMGAAQQGYGSAGSLYGQAGTQAAGVNQTDLGVQQTNAQLQQGQQGINNQTSSTFGQIGANLNQGALGQQQLAQGYQGMGVGVMGQQLNANENMSSQSLGQGNIATNNAIAQRTQDQAQLSSGLQGAAQVYGSYARGGGGGGGGGGRGDDITVYSDRNAKTGIQPANMALSIQPSPALPSTSTRLAALGGAPQAFHSSPAGLALLQGAGGAMPMPVARVPPPVAAPMPSGAPTRAASPMGDSAGQSTQAALGQLTGIGTTTMQGAQGVAGLPAGAYDPYLAAIGGTQGIDGNPNGMYMPSGYYDPVNAAYQQRLAIAATIPTNNTSTAPNPKAFDQGGTAVVPVSEKNDRGYGHASDVRSKTRIRELESQLAALQPKAPDTDALDAAYRSQGGTPIAPPAVDLRQARGYSYQYKDPSAHGQGTFYGPMAQDLEQTPAGASTVKRGPDGTKMVDTSRLSLVNTSAISEQQRKLEAMQKQLAALSQPQLEQIQRGFPTSYPTPGGVY